MAIVHTWRNCRRGRRWTYEEVEKELYKRDQESEKMKRDPEDSERCSTTPSPNAWQHHPG